MGLDEPTAEQLAGIICRNDLSATARLAWQWLMLETGAGRPWPSFARLAGTLGVSERWAWEVVRELVQVGEIHLDDRDRPSFPAVGGRPITTPDDTRGRKLPRRQGAHS